MFVEVASSKKMAPKDSRQNRIGTMASNGQTYFSKTYWILLTLYETKLKCAVVVPELGFIKRIEVPIATKKSKFTVFAAIAVPMPQAENDIAVKWNLKIPKTTMLQHFYQNLIVLDVFDSLPSNMGRYDCNWGKAKSPASHFFFFKTELKL